MKNFIFRRAKPILSEIIILCSHHGHGVTLLKIQDSSLRQLHLEVQGFTTFQRVYMT